LTGVRAISEPMPKVSKPFEITPVNAALRVKAFEMWCATDPATGKRRSVRSIANELGVAGPTAMYWCKKDRWQQRLSDVLNATASDGGVRATLRFSLKDTIVELSRIVKNPKGYTAMERISAAKALADLGSRFHVLDDELPGKQGVTQFEDELGGDNNGDVRKETTGGTDASHVSTPAGPVEADSHADDSGPGEDAGADGDGRASGQPDPDGSGSGGSDAGGVGKGNGGSVWRDDD